MLVAKANAILKSKEICDDLNSKEEHLSSLLENKDYEALSKEYDEYSKLQLSKNIRKIYLFLFLKRILRQCFCP